LGKVETERVDRIGKSQKKRKRGTTCHGRGRMYQPQKVVRRKINPEGHRYPDKEEIRCRRSAITRSAASTTGI